MLFNLFTWNVYSTVLASLLGAKFCFSGNQTTSSKQQKLVGEGVKRQGYEAGSHPGVAPLCLPDFSRQRTPGKAIGLRMESALSGTRTIPSHRADDQHQAKGCKELVEHTGSQR